MQCICYVVICIHCRASILLTVRVLINHMLACDVDDCLSFLLEDLATAVAVYEVSQEGHGIARGDDI